MVRAARGMDQRSAYKALTGEADIDVSAADYTAFVALLTIANPSAKNFIEDAWVFFDLDKATTGFGAGYTTQTIQFAVARKVDGTNYKIEANSNGDGLTATVTGTVAASDRMMGIHIGPIGPNEDARIVVVLSAETANDAELPYALYFRGPVPTLTAVAA